MSREQGPACGMRPAAIAASRRRGDRHPGSSVSEEAAE
jgi:hypothetical protein